MRVELTAIEVVVEADYDTRGELGVSDDVAPGYSQLRYIVTVVSPAPAEEVRRVIDAADKYSPYGDVFASANDIRRELADRDESGLKSSVRLPRPPPPSHLIGRLIAPHA